MSVPASTSKIVQFGVFELDLQRAELRKQGVKVKLQEQPLKVLQFLLENPGQIVSRELVPGDHLSDADLAAYVRRTGGIMHHPVGTCTMGHGPNAVVDPQLRVQGLQGLRVVDASVMPSIVSGNTNAPTIMIAEKVSDLIRGKAGLPRSDAPVWIHPQWQTAQR